MFVQSSLVNDATYHMVTDEMGWRVDREREGEREKKRGADERGKRWSVGGIWKKCGLEMTIGEKDT